MSRVIRVQVVMGSPTKNGNCVDMAAKWLEGVRAEAAAHGYTVEEKPVINLMSKNVQACKFCTACMKNPEVPACVVKDDVNSILAEVLNSDLVLHAAPIWFWSMPGPMKCYLDRFTQLFNPDFSLKKRVTEMTKGHLTFATVANCGDPNHEEVCKGAIYAFQEFGQYHPEAWRYAGAVSAASGFKHNHERCAKTVELGKASVQKFLEE